MKTTIADIENAHLEGKVTFDRWLLDFNEGFFEPMTRTMAKMMVHAQPQNIRDELSKITPDAMDKLQKNYGGK